MAKSKPLDFRGLFLHAWDLADDGVDAVLSSVAEMGLNTLCIAGTYHSGWFIHPSSTTHRTFMIEGSVCYFRPQASLYRGTRLKPIVSSICRRKDWIVEAGKRLDRYGLRMISWTIGTHNTRLGLAHPELTQQNVYGDRMPHALCIGNADVRAYLLAVCRDLATNYPMWGLQLESFGWMNVAHNHHHERDLVGLTPLERELISICVLSACAKLARGDDVDMPAVKRLIRGVLDNAFNNAPNRPARHPKAIEELEAKSPELAHFNAWRARFAGELIVRIKREALKGTDCKLLLQSGFDATLADAVDGFACGVYGKSPTETAKICRAAVEATPKRWDGLMQCFVRLGMGVPKSAAELRAIVDAVAGSGCNGINFYNRSESPPRMLGWVKGALAGKIR